ncbi:MAG: FecR family protein [Parachlamydiales bacterium]|nr:FecR family protein [Parachlamydiales bacterium]
MKKIFLLLLPVVCWCAEPIGTVIAVTGDVKAIDSKKNSRILAVQSGVFVGDTLITDEVAKGQIQFNDGTLLLLIPGSQLDLNSYGNSRFSSTLAQGGIRVSTGLIAKKNPENFEINTANATIGVRGTIFETRLYLGSLLVGSSQGGVVVKNQGGTLDIATDQFAEAPAKNVPPHTLDSRPAPLDLAVFEPPSNGGVPFQPTGAGAVAGKMASGGFPWGTAIGSVAVMAAALGVVGAAASQNPTTSAH